MNIIKLFLWLTWMVFISGCASHIPPEIKQPLDNAPSVAQVHANSAPFISQKVRWGGVILQTDNKDNASSLRIVAYPLNAQGKPVSGGLSPGRFIAITDRFLEPKTYSADRKVTIVGNLLRTQTAQVDAFAYEYPLIEVEQIYLWAIQPDQPYRRRAPYWVDPWYYPYSYGYYSRHHFFNSHYYYRRPNHHY